MHMHSANMSQGINLKKKTLIIQGTEYNIIYINNI